MDNKTDKILFGAGLETETIEIADPSLNQADMEVIASKIGGFPNLRRLTIANSNLNDKMMEPLIGAIAQHPSLSELNFSGNQFTKLEFMKQIIAGPDSNDGNPRIRAIDLSGNKGEIASRAGANFFKTLFKADNCAVLKTNIDPWDFYNAGYAVFNDPDPVIEHALNVLEMSFGDWHHTYSESEEKGRYIKVDGNTKKQWVSELCARNRQEAMRLLARIKEAKIITAADLEEVNKRLPAILYIGEQADDREQIVELLRNFYKRAQQISGLVVDTVPFRSQIPARKKSAPSAAPAEVVAEKTFDIDQILAGMPAFDEAKMRKQIEDCLEHPATLQKLGAVEVRTASHITTASLHVMASMPTMETVETFMEGFLSKFQEARVFVESIINRSIRTALADVRDELLKEDPPPPSQGVFSSFFGHKNTLADAASLVNEAGQFLTRATAEVEKNGRDMASQIETTDVVSSAYVKVINQMNQILAVGRQVADERQKKLVPANDPGRTADSEQESTRLELLDTRLESLRQTMENLRGHLAPYTVHASLEQRQSEKISGLAEQHLPLLVEEVSVLAGHLITSGPASGRAQSEARRNADVEAAIQTFQRIGSVVANMLGNLREIDDAATAIRGHISQLFPATALTQQPTRENHAVGLRALPQHQL